jgi:hypothetical protein
MKKKSLIESLKATRKANVVTAPAKSEGSSTRKVTIRRQGRARRKMVGPGI